MTLRRLAAVAGALVPDGLMIVGIAAISYGAAQVYSPAGWIVSGAFSLAFGVLLARRGGDA